MQTNTSPVRLATQYNLKQSLVQALLQISHGEAVTLINEIAGNLPTPDKAVHLKQANLVKDELNELFDNIEAGNYKAVRDDIADVKFTIEGIASRLGMAPTTNDEIEVVLSNFTKFDINEELALETKAKYERLGVVTEYHKHTIQLTDLDDGAQPEFTFYVTKSAKDQMGLDGKFHPAGKWLKSVNFLEPVYRDNSFSVEFDKVIPTEKNEVEPSKFAFGIFVDFSGNLELAIEEFGGAVVNWKGISCRVESVEHAKEVIKNFFVGLKIKLNPARQIDEVASTEQLQKYNNQLNNLLTEINDLVMVQEPTPRERTVLGIKSEQVDNFVLYEFFGDYIEVQVAAEKNN